MRIRLSKHSIQWLFDKRIFFQGWNENGFRLQPGDICTAPDHPAIEPYCAVYKGTQICPMGAFSYTHSNFPIDFRIGRYCSVAWDVKFPGPRHPMSLLSTSAFMMDLGPDLWMTYLKDQHEVFRNVQANPQKPGTVIGHDVWIAQDVSIMRGLTIGDGAVIAAAAVVTKDVPPYAIVGGNPARIIRFRFPPDIIDALMLMRWWRYSYTHFNKIDLSDIRRTIQELQPILADLPEYTPSLINLSEMPNDGIV